VTIDRGALLVEPGKAVVLADYDPCSTGDFETKGDAQKKLRADLKRLSALQDVFYADGRYALSIVFEGMDTAGKDGAVKHVMSGVNPQGVDVHSFKTPSSEERAHDYLWRSEKVLPQRGRIGISNRSYYEEVCIVRVHKTVLENEALPAEDLTARLWDERFEDIIGFERHLVRNGTRILKFFLHVSREEQRRRLLARIDDPNKNWKLQPSDIDERPFWNAYQQAYEDILTNSSTADAPWYVIPADRKWFTRAAVADIIVATLESLRLAYPAPDEAQSARLARYREELAGAAC
jgi:PPK2 family polyphosphate:nucleotide phosphotransferase